LLPTNLQTTSRLRNFYKFFPNNYIVIVEGRDDVVFWNNFFPKEVLGYSLKIKKVDGKEQVKKFMASVQTKNAPYIVAVDSDFNAFGNNYYGNRRIIETICYSIENLMICKCKVSKLISDYLRMDKKFIKDVEKSLDHYDENVFPLMCADYLLLQRGSEEPLLLKESCYRYLTEKKGSTLFSKRKIKRAIKKKCKEKIDEVLEKFKGYEPRFYSNGHFFIGYVYNFIKSFIKKKMKRRPPSVSLESFFVHLNVICPSCIKELSFYKKIVDAINPAVEDLIKLLQEKNTIISPMLNLPITEKIDSTDPAL
jgi:hypothetical protein